jgi:hypothetical protein
MNLVILQLNLVMVKLFGDASLKFGDEPINLVMNKI